MTDTYDDPITLRLRELSDDPGMRAFALEQLDEPDRARVLAMEAAEVDPSPERLRAICESAVRRARLLDALARAKRLGLQVVNAADALAGDVARWLLEKIDRIGPPAPAYCIGDSVRLLVEDLYQRDKEFPAEIDSVRWKGEGTLRIEFRAPLGVAEFRGWREAGLMVRLPDRKSSQVLFPTQAEKTETHCRFVFDLPFVSHTRGDGRDGKGLPVPIELIEEIRLMPVPI